MQFAIALGATRKKGGREGGQKGTKYERRWLLTDTFLFLILGSIDPQDPAYHEIREVDPSGSAVTYTYTYLHWGKDL